MSYAVHSLLLTCLLLDGGFSLSAKEKAAEQKKDAPKVETTAYPVHVGLPQWMGGRGMLYIQPEQGLDAKLNSSPFEYWVAKVTVFAVWLTVIALVGLIAGGVMAYFGVPLWDETMIISGGVLALSLATVLLVDMLVTVWPWLVGITIVAVVLYIAYLLLTKTKLLQNCRELCQSGAKMKQYTKWEDSEKKEILSIQSDATINLVNKFEKEEAARREKAEQQARKAERQARKLRPQPACGQPPPTE